VVVATGMATELGRLAELRSGTPAEPTPPQRRLAVLGRWMAAATPVVCAVVSPSAWPRASLEKWVIRRRS